MRNFFALAILLSLCLPLAAEDEYRALFKERWGGVYCNGSTVQVPDKTGTRTLLKTEAGPVTITKAGFGYVFQFPKWSATVQQQVDGSIRVRFGPDTFVFKQSTTAFEANLPKDKVVYTLTGGRVTAIHGKAGSVNIRTTFATGTYTIFGPNGKTRLQLLPKGKKFAVSLIEGEPVDQIPYLVQGYRFEDSQSGVGIFVAVPGGKLTQAMPWKSSALYKPPVINPVKGEEAREPSPLQAITGNGDPLKASLGSPKDIEGRFNAPGEDWLKEREAPKGEDHLKANLGEAGLDPLNVRQHAKPEITAPARTGSSTPSVNGKPQAHPAGYDDAEDDLVVPNGQTP